MKLITFFMFVIVTFGFSLSMVTIVSARTNTDATKRVLQTSADQHNTQLWVNSTEITSILEHIDATTLVVFDIDYTLFRASHSLGTPEWIMHLIDRDMKKGASREQGFKKYYPLWIKAQQFNDIVLMDKKIPILFKKIQEQGGNIIALTSRQSSCKEMTNQQLKMLGLRLDNSPIAQLKFSNPFKYPAVFYQGVLFAHDFNEKGLVFAAWLKQIAPELTQKPIKKIVFVDDLQKNVQSMQSAVETLGLAFYGLRYSAGDQYKAAFKPALAEEEAMVLMESINNPKLSAKYLRSRLEALRLKHSG